MLVVMTFNTWLFISVVVGLTAGYFFGYFVTESLRIEDNAESDQVNHLLTSSSGLTESFKRPNFFMKIRTLYL